MVKKTVRRQVEREATIVFSQTLDRAPWGTWDEGRIVKTSAADEVAKLKGESGKDIVVWGSICSRNLS